jgi:hypothetical protein
VYKALNSLARNYPTGNLVFLLCCVLFYFLNSPYLLHYPTGIHFIRQTDSLSFVLYYLNKENFNFFDVGNLNLSFQDGKTACEFPLFYYFYFLYFKLFGVNFTVVRVFSLVLFISSLYLLFINSFKYFENWIVTFVLILLVISSSVLRYFIINFLPDSLAFSFLLMGMSFFIPELKKNELKAPKSTYFFFILAALLKAYYGIYIVIIASVPFIR